MFRKENLILTYASGEPIFRDENFWVFVRSVKRAENADCVMLTHEMPESARDRLELNDITIVDIAPQDMHFLYRDRHLSYYNYLNNHGHKYKHVISTDCRDVYFQSNPFEWVDGWKSRHNHIHGDKSFLNHFVILVAEGFKMAESGFACVEHFEFERDVPRPYMKEDRDRWVLNGGTILGSSRAMQDFHFLIWMTTMKSFGRCTDQAAINWMMHYLDNDDTYQITFPQHDYLCLTGEGVKMKSVNATIKDGKIVNEYGAHYCMVHQWDRVEYLKEFVLAQDLA